MPRLPNGLIARACAAAIPSLAAAPVVGHSDIAPGRKTDPGAGISTGGSCKPCSAISTNSWAPTAVRIPDMNFLALMLGLSVEKLLTNLFHLREFHWLDPLFDAVFRRVEDADRNRTLIMVSALVLALVVPVALD